MTRSEEAAGSVRSVRGALVLLWLMGWVLYEAVLAHCAPEED